MSCVMRIPPVTDKAANDRAWAVREASCKLAELGYQICEFTLEWPTTLAWNLAQAGLMACGHGIGQRETLEDCKAVLEDIATRSISER